MTQAEYEELTGQLDFDYSVNAVICPPQLHSKLRSRIQNAWNILAAEYESFGNNRMNVVEPNKDDIQPVDPHQVWWTALSGPGKRGEVPSVWKNITLPVQPGRFECPYCERVYSQKCTLHSHKVQHHRDQYVQERQAAGLPPLPPVQ